MKTNIALALLFLLGAMSAHAGVPAEPASVTHDDYCLGSFDIEDHFYPPVYYTLDCTSGTFQSEHVKAFWQSSAAKLQPVLTKSVLEPLEAQGYKKLGRIYYGGLDVVVKGQSSQDDINNYCLVGLRILPNPAKNPPFAQIFCAEGALLSINTRTDILHMTSNEAKETLERSGYTKVANLKGFDVYENRH
jgi:hypothetical protein